MRPSLLGFLFVTALVAGCGSESAPSSPPLQDSDAPIDATSDSKPDTTVLETTSDDAGDDAEDAEDTAEPVDSAIEAASDTSTDAADASDSADAGPDTSIDVGSDSSPDSSSDASTDAAADVVVMDTAAETADAAADVAATPVVVSLSPAPLQIAAGGGTGILKATLSAPAPVGGSVVAITVTGAGVLVPPTVTVLAGETSVWFRVRASGSAGATATVSATVGGGAPATASVSVVAVASAPAAGELVINEINGDVGPGGSADANCSGTVNDATDEFVEIVNVATHPVQLSGVSLWDEAALATATTPRFSFSSLILGPGEVVVVFGGAYGTTGTGPWCAYLTSTTIGDALALPGASLALNNAGDTVTITATSAKTSAVLATAAYAGVSDQSAVRSPDVVGTSLLPHTTALNAATDRVFSPGTRVDGRLFAMASPP